MKYVVLPTLFVCVIGDRPTAAQESESPGFHNKNGFRDQALLIYYHAAALLGLRQKMAKITQQVRLMDFRRRRSDDEPGYVLPSCLPTTTSNSVCVG